MQNARRWMQVMSAALAVAASLALPVAGVAAGDQIEAGYLASWEDKSTWTRPVAGTTALVEVGVGLVLEGGSGPMRLAFYVVRATRGAASSRPPVDINVRAAAGSRMNPNLIRTPTLSFTHGSPEADTETIDVSSSMAVNDPAPGAAVESGVAKISAEAFQTMLEAPEIGANIFGAEVTLREDQIEALRAFRDRLFPPG